MCKNNGLSCLHVKDIVFCTLSLIVTFQVTYSFSTISHFIPFAPKNQPKILLNYSKFSLLTLLNSTKISSDGAFVQRLAIMMHTRLIKKPTSKE